MRSTKQMYYCHYDRYRCLCGRESYEHHACITSILHFNFIQIQNVRYCFNNHHDITNWRFRQESIINEGQRNNNEMNQCLSIISCKITIYSIIKLKVL